MPTDDTFRWAVLGASVTSIAASLLVIYTRPPFGANITKKEEILQEQSPYSDYSESVAEDDSRILFQIEQRAQLKLKQINANDTPEEYLLVLDFQVGEWPEGLACIGNFNWVKEVDCQSILLDCGSYLKCSIKRPMVHHQYSIALKLELAELPLEEFVIFSPCPGASYGQVYVTNEGFVKVKNMRVDPVRFEGHDNGGKGIGTDKTNEEIVIPTEESHIEKKTLTSSSKGNWNGEPGRIFPSRWTQITIKVNHHDNDKHGKMSVYVDGAKIACYSDNECPGILLLQHYFKLLQQKKRLHR